VLDSAGRVCVCVAVVAGVAMHAEWAGLLLPGEEKERYIVAKACVCWWVRFERRKIKYQVYFFIRSLLRTPDHTELTVCMFFSLVLNVMT
jgi:hypothetical protein